MKKRGLVTVLGLAVILFILQALIVHRSATAATAVFINEIHYDNTGTDAGEAIEIAGPAGTDLTGWSLVLYNGSGGAPYNTMPLGGAISDQQNGFGTLSFSYPVNGIQNGAPDGIALVDPSNAVVQFLSYEGTFAAVGGPADGLTSTDIGVSEPGTGPVGESLQLTGTGQFYEDFTWSASSPNTFGAVNTGQTFSAGGGGPQTSVFVNEIHYDNAGTDAGEAIEIAGPAGTDLTGWSLVLYNGSGGAPYNTNLLTGVIPNQQAGFGTLSFSYPVNGIQNGAPDGLALVDASNAVVQFLSYEGTFAAVGGPADGLTSTDIGVSEGSSDPLGNSLQLMGTGQFYEDFTWSPSSPNTFGLVNTGQTFAGDGVIRLSINDVSVGEGDTGTTTATFTVSLTLQAGPGGVSFDIATEDGTATVADNDYVALSLAGQLIPEGSLSKTFDVTINGDLTIEPDETFFVNVTNVSGAMVTKGQAVGTIVNDDAQIIAIHDIQGSGSTSPLAGQNVTTTGIVTGRKSNGFFIQTPASEVDSDSNTSEGIFVFTGSAPPAGAATGNLVKVTGTVAEFIPSADPNSPPLTEISGSPAVSVLSTGNALPSAVTITSGDTNPSGSIEQLERFEGMRVRALLLRTISPTQGSISEPNATSTSNGVFYAVIFWLPRPFREEGIQVPDPLPPGSPAGVPRFDANPERLRVDSDGLMGALALEVTTGAFIANVMGPLDYAFRTYTILPEPGTLTQASVIGNGDADPVPSPCSGEFTVSSFNMQRFFDTVNDPGIGDPVLTATAFDNRLNKASLVIRNVLRSPDILGVQEVENLSTLEAIAAKVNADSVAAGAPNPDYQAFLVEGNDIGGIDVGFLVKGARVTVVDVVQEGKTTTFINPNNGQPETLNDRPPLILRAIVQPPVGAGFPVTVIVNHLRSLNGIDSPVDGNRVRTKRRAQAEFLANLIQARQLADPAERIISVGDYNAFQVNDGYVDVIGTIKGTPAPFDEVVLASGDLVDPDLTDLVDLIFPHERYSFVFDGNAQVLDHILVNGAAKSRLNRFHYARVNADFPESFRNDPTRPERISDHDIPVAYFQLPLVITGASVDKPVLWPPNHKLVLVKVDYDVANNCGLVFCKLDVTSNEPASGTGSGDTAPDWIVLGPHHVYLRAERAGNGNGRVYTITITCKDLNGNTATETVTVTVPKNQGQ